MFRRFWNWLTAGIVRRAYAEGMEDGIRAGRIDAYRRLRGDAYWFTEDMVTYRLLFALANSNLNVLEGKPGMTLEDIRKDWRTERASTRRL